MKKRTHLFFLVIIAVLVFSGCGAKNVETTQTPPGAKEETKKPENSGTAELSQKCQEEKVNLPNYGDPGQRLTNCFVKYPGEPTREDKSYYIVEDICGQFTKEFMENMLGQALAKIEPPKTAFVNNCTYYFDDKENLMLNLEYLKIENQKIGNEAAGFKVEKDARIPMENLVATQEDGAINVIYLVLNPQKFLSMRPSSKKAIENDKFISLAANIAQAIKSYK
jgi:hypothetical protein